MKMEAAIEPPRLPMPPTTTTMKALSTQSRPIVCTADDGLQHGATGHAHDIGDHRVKLDVGVFQRLLQSLDVTSSLTDQLLACPQQAAQNLRRGVRHEAGSDQAVSQKIGEPSRVVDVGLASRNVLDVPGIRQHQ